jgi:hypothetical protein
MAWLSGSWLSSRTGIFSSQTEWECRCVFSMQDDLGTTRKRRVPSWSNGRRQKLAFGASVSYTWSRNTYTFTRSIKVDVSTQPIYYTLTDDHTEGLRDPRNLCTVRMVGVNIYPKENDLLIPFAPTNICPLGCLDGVVNVDVDERGIAGPTTNLLQFASF